MTKKILLPIHTVEKTKGEGREPSARSEQTERLGFEKIEEWELDTGGSVEGGNEGGQRTAVCGMCFIPNFLVDCRLVECSIIVAFPFPYCSYT